MPPRPVSDVLKRPRLIERLRANANSPVTLVAADAGCGKTTLISDFLRDQTRPFVWYQLDHTDADPVVFLNYVANGIKNIQPDFGEALFPYLTESGEDVLRHPERAADLFINEVLSSVENPFVLVLDDYHHIGTETIVHRIVDRMLQYSAEYLHLIITTRDLPPLAIMRRRTQSAALVIDRDDLLFTDGEVRELFRSTLKVELSDAEISEYRKRTHGWVTALQLVRQIAGKDGVGDDGAVTVQLTDVLARSEKDIFDYFAEEVFAREDIETQNLLMDFSLLESLPLETCSLLFPQMRCSAVLPELVQKNIFLTAAGDSGHAEEYRFHPLFRDFLLRRKRSYVGQAGVAAERRRIATAFLDDNRWEAALPFLLDAEDFDTAAKVIAGHGGEWVLAGAIASLETVSDRIPAVHLEKHPRSLLHRAEAARLQGNIDKSSSLLNRVVKLFADQGDKAGEAEALHSLASIARRRGRTADALGLLETAERLAGPDSQTILKCVNTRGLCFIQEGKWNEAEQQFRIALEHAEKQSDEQYIRLIAHNLALAPGFRGDFGEALRWFQRIFREDAPGKKFPHDAIGHLNVARLRLLRGELDIAEHHLERALELCQLFNLRSLLPEIFETYANHYRERSDFAHAAEFYERSANAYADAGIDLANRELNEERAKFALVLGDTVRARSLIESLVEARTTSGSEVNLNTAKLCLARIDLNEVSDGRLEELKARCTELLAFFHERNHYYYEAEAAMLLAEVCFRRSENPEMVAAVQRAIELSARFDYEYWLRGEIRRSPAIFASEDVVENLPPDLQQELARGTPEPSVSEAVVSEIQRPITDLTVHVLGHVEIFRDPSRPFAADAWTTRRARDIFCYIATRKNRRAPKEVLIEAFWGNEDPDAIEKNFHPTISHIRKALNSRQSLKQNFIMFRDGAYQLNPDFSYRIDTEEFLNEISHAKAAKSESRTEDFRSHLENAVTLYRGEFMEGLYEDWADEQRTFFAEQFNRVLNALAKLSVTEKRWTDAHRYANQILAIDPYREDLHRLVMRVLAAQGKTGAVKKHFEQMSALLKQDLGIAPSAETRKVFGEMMG